MDTSNYNAITWGGLPGNGDEDNANLSGAFGLQQGAGAAGDGELPVYFHAGVMGASLLDGTPRDFAPVDYNPAEVCSTEDHGSDGFALGNVRYIAFTVFDKSTWEATESVLDTQPDVTIDITYTGSDSPVTVARLVKLEKDQTEEIFFSTGALNPDVQIASPLDPGAYILEVSHAGNLSSAGISGVTPGDVCYDVYIDDYTLSIFNP